MWHRSCNWRESAQPTGPPRLARPTSLDSSPGAPLARAGGASQGGPQGHAAYPPIYRRDEARALGMPSW
eukprot:2550796-Alexandrium_andersonii.AAC.1